MSLFGHVTQDLYDLTEVFKANYLRHFVESLNNVELHLTDILFDQFQKDGTDLLEGRVLAHDFSNGAKSCGCARLELSSAIRVHTLEVRQQEIGNLFQRDVLNATFDARDGSKLHFEFTII